MNIYVFPGEQKLPPPEDCGHPHYRELFYYEPHTWMSNPCPFSRGYKTAEEAEAAALEFTSRREWVK